MSNVLVFSDIHVAPHKKSIDRLHDCLKALNWVFDVADGMKVKHIVFGGDLFQDRQHIDVMTYHLTFQLIKDRVTRDNINFWALLGNHDLWYYDKWDISSVSPFSAIRGFTVIDKPTTTKVNGVEVDFLPYTINPLGHLDELRSVASNRKGRKILFGHLAVHNAKLSIIHNTRSDVIIEHDNEMVFVDADAFHGWDNVFLGHYHGAQKVSESVEYIGSPLQLTFNEAFQVKHAILLNLKTGQKEYIVNDFSPQHLVIPEEEISNFELKGNFVRVTVKSSSTVDQFDLKKLIETENPSTVEIIPEDDEAPEHLVEDAKAILQEQDKMLDVYVSKCDIGNLDHPYLIEWGTRICKEATEQLC